MSHWLTLVGYDGDFPYVPYFLYESPYVIRTDPKLNMATFSLDVL